MINRGMRIVSANLKSRNYFMILLHLITEVLNLFFLTSRIFRGIKKDQ